MNTQPVLAFIGAGNMARAIIGGLLSNHYPATKIWASQPDSSKLSDLEALGIHTTNDNNLAATQADVVILAVKPQVMQSVARDLSGAIQQKKPLIVSVAAGIMNSSLSDWLGGDVAIVRCMPNTPALVQTGANGLYANDVVTQHQKEQAENILQATGITLWVDSESQIDAVTAVSGSGPAYYFMVMEAMIAAGVKLGLTEDTATALTLQTAQGAARMAEQSDLAPAELRRRVTSPKGTTEQAIKCFEEGELEELFMKAMQACNDRSEELARELGK